MSDKACPDCGTTFPLRKSGGVCQLCIEINSHPVDSEKRREAETFNQCYVCGTWRKRNMTPAGPDSAKLLCGAPECDAFNVGDQEEVDKSTTSSSILSHTPKDYQYVQAARNDKLRARLRLQSKSTPNLQVVGNTSSHSTASLRELQAERQVTAEPKCAIGYQVRFKSKINSDLGAGVKAYPLSSFLGDVKQEIVKQINHEWTQLGTGHHPYLVEEVTIRWSGNRSLDADTTSLKLRDFLNYYTKNSSINAAIGLQHCPTIFKSSMKTYKAMPMMFFEMLLSHEAFEARIAATHGGNYSASALLQSSIRSIMKRPRNTSSADLESEKIKQRNTNVQGPDPYFPSRFKPSARQQRMETRLASSVTLSKTIATVADDTSGECSLLTLNGHISGMISDAPLAHGLMKVAFELIIPGEDKRYVAKRFFRAEADDQDINTLDAIALLYVSPEVHAPLIELELYRLAEAAWFLKEFYYYCRSQHPSVPVYKNIQIASAYVGKETNTMPSSASGLSQQHTGSTATWLVEERRSSSVTKFSGTLSHAGVRQDPASAAIYAFSHFVLWHSNGTQVYADIQGTLHNINGVDIMVLFDIMSHTGEGESGVGDFGPEGIESFIKSHKCSSVCEALQLDQHHTLAKDKEVVYDGAGEKSKKKKRKDKDREEGQVTESDEEEEEEE